MKNKFAIMVVSLILIIGLISYFVYRNISKGIISSKTKIVVVFKDYKNLSEFWKVAKSGIDTAAKEFDINVDFTGSDSESDIQGQIDIVDKLIKEKPSAIVMAAADFDALVPIAEKIKKADIKLITIDSGINSNVSNSFIATDNVEAGRKAGEKLQQIANNNLKFAIVSYVKGSATAIEREKGIKKGLGATNSNRLIETVYCDNYTTKAYEITKKLMQDNPDIGGIAGLNDNSTIGVARAIKDLGLSGKVKIVGFDNSIDEATFIEENVIQGTVVQKPFSMGYLGIKTAIQLLKGDKVAKRIDTGSELITKENMYTIKNQKLFFPFIGK